MHSWPLYLAFKQLFPSRKRGSFFLWVATVGVMLGVMVLLVVQCVMGGFGAEICRLVVETGGDIRIESGRAVEGAASLLELAESAPNVKGATPYAEGIVMMEAHSKPSFPYIRGIDVERERKIVPLDKYVQYGRLDDLDEEGVLLSVGLARNLGATVGAKVLVYSPLLLDKLKDEEVLLPQELRVVGIFETGWNQVDANLAIVTLERMQELYGLGDNVHGVMLRLEDTKKEAETLAWLAEHLPPFLSAYTVLSANQDLLFILKLEKMTLFFIILFVILVAAFSITSSLMTTVVRKTREIGLLAAMGASPWQIASCFCLQGFFIGVLGTALGVAGGLLALFFRNDVIHFFARLTHSEEALLEFYQFANLPVVYDPVDFWMIIPTAIIITTLAGILPAIKAARLDPAEALRADV